MKSITIEWYYFVFQNLFALLIYESTMIMDLLLYKMYMMKLNSLVW